ncbi:MAG: D-alanyl-D-alanine carboxypeptidase [Clostridia bacterium]|nr:D-alanyl-D-alanine carboxypeptidase [Clostridia bacterium]
MKQKIVLIVILVFCLNLVSSADAAALEVSAKSAVLICADSGQILYALNENMQMPMASTTKIMTALLALENLPLNETVTVGNEVLRVDGTSLGLKPGDRIVLYDLVCGMMLASGNDAANAVAVAVSGSVDAFVALMNLRAKEIGMENTVFGTPSGLDAQAHFSTAADMALLTRTALRNEAFAQIASTYNAKISIGDRTVWLTNHNRLLNSYSGMTGVKTGFTKKSGRCLVTSAQRNDTEIIAVTLQAPDDWNDHRALLDYGFSVTETYTLTPETQTYYVDVVGSAISRVSCSANGMLAYSAQSQLQDVEQVVCLPQFIYAPARAGEVIGEILFFNEGQYMDRVPLCLDENIDVALQMQGLSFTDRILQKLNGWFLNG